MRYLISIFLTVMIMLVIFGHWEIAVGLIILAELIRIICLVMADIGRHDI